ncbi:class I SAM-dependent methyltransferase [Paracoccus denitrificans]|uniref:class I SAM-dependent methyltransferase n=1 Tax=Paracoccus denitrificans TaxID=266 RepID=UPI001E28F5CE|nr:class I SAM-dependent methyltransferase [Paracoccus denitrificans]UFS66596.1 class I SAM-dependent methyltransferase [Paracoccus denitrificans]
MQHPNPLEKPEDLLARARSVSSDTAGVLITSLREAGARRILELGCGDGTITALLHEAGFDVTGLDPSAEALARARARLPSVTFIEAHAEALPELRPFDAACFVNALHHVEPSAMTGAVLNALSILRPGGLLHVVEPLATGSFFRAMRPVEDESAIRQKAVQAVESLISEGRIVLRDLRRWTRESRFRDLEEFVDYLARVDPDRAALAQGNAAALARAWRDNIRVRDGKAVLVQPLVCWTLARAEDSGGRP